MCTCHKGIGLANYTLYGQQTLAAYSTDNFIRYKFFNKWSGNGKWHGIFHYLNTSQPGSFAGFSTGEFDLADNIPTVV